LEQRATIFVEAMVIIAVVGVLAFLIGLLARMPLRQQAAGSGAGQPAQAPQWYEFTLAFILLAAIAAFAVWLISNGREWIWGETIENWQTDTRTIVFAAIMVGLGVIGLVVSLIYTLVHSARHPATARSIATVTEAAPAAAAAVLPTPSPVRVIGLLALALSILLLCWIGLAPASQYGLIAQLIYPASLGVALVLIFDKATRVWGAKGAAETTREWLFCDLLIFLLVLAFLNLRGLAKTEAYASSALDILNVVLFFAMFWLIDRSSTRARFAAGYVYLIVLPLLLLIWQTVQGAEVSPSWWSSVWPFLILAAVFLVLEVITLVASTGERQRLPLFKDAVFVLLYVVLLIVAARYHG
jgi:hypothetical protein